MGIEDLYSPKQLEVLRTAVRENWRFLIGHGAKRAGKTAVNNDIFLMELRRVRKLADQQTPKVETPMYILAGYSSKSLQNNVLQELSNKYGFDFKFDKHNSFELFGVKVVQTFTGTIGGLGAIRGMTAWGAYVNEASLANQEVFEEIKDRCSGPGARIIGDTNPDNPQHWLKKDYIDNTDPKARIVSVHFRMDDNIFLSKEYIADQKAGTPSGMFYDRSIEGLWVSGEGAIYKDFDEKQTLINKDDVPDIKEYYAGVDWGYEHKGSVLVFGDDYFGNTYLLEEHTAQYEEIDYWVDIAKGIVDRYGDINFWCDGARPEHVARFINEDITAMYADKAVLSGIEAVARLIKLHHFYVVRQTVKSDDSCYLEEVYNYAWDKKTGKPIKLMDDVMDAKRYAIYSQHQDYNEIESGGGI
ncbi:PBSX family phage terminase large subunit [Latilactobacillus sp. 5-91]|uniref:PBSX family phage terminase large subunit n=1 Tax=Latilactobacillus sp. 5-91 TaxID=3410924 RepID=UPI003C738070